MAKLKMRVQNDEQEYEVEVEVVRAFKQRRGDGYVSVPENMLVTSIDKRAKLAMLNALNNNNPINFAFAEGEWPENWRDGDWRSGSYSVSSRKARGTTEDGKTVFNLDRPRKRKTVSDYMKDLEVRAGNSR